MSVPAGWSERLFQRLHGVGVNHPGRRQVVFGLEVALAAANAVVRSGTEAGGYPRTLCGRVGRFWGGRPGLAASLRCLRLNPLELPEVAGRLGLESCGVCLFCEDLAMLLHSWPPGTALARLSG